MTGVMMFVSLGVLVGILLSVLGRPGALLITPLLMVVAGLPAEMAVPISLAHFAALMVPGTAGQWQSGNIDLKMLILLLVGVGPGVMLAGKISYSFPHWLAPVILFPYVILLLGAVIYKIRRFPVLPGPGNAYRLRVVKIIGTLPLKLHFATIGMAISAAVPVVLGIIFGFTGQIFGPLAALIISPVLVVCLDIPVMVATGTAGVASVMGSLIIALMSGFAAIPLNLQILLWLFLGSSVTFLAISALLQINRLYPLPVAAMMVLVTSVTLWALLTGQPNLNLLIHRLPIHVGFFGGVWS